MKIRTGIKSFYQIAKTSWQQFCQDDGWVKSAGLAYVTLLSIVPLLTVVFSILSAFPVFKSIGAKVQNMIFAHLIAESAETVQHYFQIFINQANQLSVLGFLFLLLTAIVLIFSMEHTFNAIWRIKSNRRGMTAFFLYWSVITLAPIAVASIVWVSNYLSSLSFMADPTFSFVRNILAFADSYLITFLAIIVLYLALPNRKVPLKSAAIAAIVTTILFEVARKGFAFYITHLATYKVIYGAVAAVPIFLLWLYISWLIILFGAVVNAVVAEYAKFTINP